MDQLSNRVVWPDGSRNVALSTEAAQPPEVRAIGGRVGSRSGAQKCSLPPPQLIPGFDLGPARPPVRWQGAYAHWTSFVYLLCKWQLHRKDGSYSLTIPKHLNRPGTSEELQQLGRAGTSLTVEHERYSELGARISWLRAGYLALVAMEGYKIVLDPAMDIVRTQIRECDERRMLTFVADAQEDFPLTIRRVLRVLEPAWHLGWTVQFGPYLVNLPSRGDMTFYERLANNGLSPTVQHTTYEYVGWPTTPTFGLLQNEAT